MNMKQNKSVIYARVSSKEQEDTGYSLPAQEKLSREYAERKNFTITKVFSVAESASGSKQRKVFAEMIAYMEDDDIQNLLCEKVDRLTRNLKEAVVANEWLEGDDSRSIHFVKQNLIIHNHAKSDEKFRWDIEIVLAKKFISNLSEEVRKGQKEKLAQGWLPTKPPIGYKTIGEKGHKTPILNEATAPLVKRMLSLYATGNYSINALVEIMYKEGLRNNKDGKFGKTRLHESLSDPFYYGKMRWKGEIYDAQHEPLISKELFDIVQQKLNRSNNNPQYKKHLPVFKAKIKCEECGGIIAWEIQKGHWYGHCNHYRKCSQKHYVRQENVETQLFPYFDKVAPKDARILQWLEKAIKESHSEEIDYNTAKREELNRIIRTADKRIENAYRDKLDGKMPSALCEKMIKESTDEKEDALSSLGKLSKDRTAYYEAGYAVHELASKAEVIYKDPETTEDQKRLLLSRIFSNLTLKADSISPNYTLAFEFLAEWMPQLNSIFEPLNNSSIKGKEDAFTSSHPVLLRRQDSNLRPRDYMCSSCFQDAWTISSPLHECIRSEALRPLAESTPLRDSL
jgi:site-specific DNA recombinase